MKINKSFERDFKWFLSMRHIFDFDGTSDYINKYGNPIIVYDKNGVDGKSAFYEFDSTGKIKPTKHPNLLYTLLKIKGGTNLHIKMYAEDRAAGNMSLIELRGLCIKFKSPYWFREAIENQKIKYLIK